MHCIQNYVYLCLILLVCTPWSTFGCSVESFNHEAQQESLPSDHISHDASISTLDSGEKHTEQRMDAPSEPHTEQKMEGDSEPRAEKSWTDRDLEFTLPELPPENTQEPIIERVPERIKRDEPPKQICEAPTGSRCFYIDPKNGMDTHPGTFKAPWKTFVNINVSIYGKYRPKTWVKMQPGDIIYLKNGIYDTLYHPGDDNGPTGGGSYIFHTQGAKGTASKPIQLKAYPGHHPIFDPKHRGLGIRLLQTEYVVVQGIEIRNANNRGMLIAGSQNIHVKDMHIHDTDGLVANNVAGMGINGSEHITVFNVKLHDNYDRKAAQSGRQTHNSCNLVLFSCRGKIRIHHSIFYYTQSRAGQHAGCGIKYKHASPEPTSTFEVSDSYFENHKYFAIGTGTAHTHIHHNIIHGAPYALTSEDHGGPTHQNDQIFEYNSIYKARALYVSPTLRWIQHKGHTWPGLKNIHFRHNIVYDTTSRYTSDLRTVLLNSYMSDALFTALKPAIQFTENCYYNPNTSVSFGFAGSNQTGRRLGGFHTFSSWKKTYLFDVQSKSVDPQFTSISSKNFTLLPGSPCSSLGAHTSGHTPKTQK